MKTLIHNYKLSIGIIFSLCMMMIMNICYSQTAVRLGYGICNMTFGNSPYESSSSLWRTELGFSFGDYEMEPDHFNFSAEILLGFKGAKYSYFRTDVPTSGDEYEYEQNYKIKLTYLELPLIWRREITNQFGVEFGISGGLLLGAKRQGSTTITNLDSDNTSTTSEDGRFSNKEVFADSEIEGANKRPLNYYDYGMNVGALYDFGDFFIGLRYYYGLADVFKNNYPAPNTSVIRNNNKCLKFILVVPMD